MTIEEIFSQIAAHMRKGLMIHDQLASIYGFLNLHGYQKCHEYHFLEESLAYRNLINFYFNTYNKLIITNNLEAPQLIPVNWLKYTKKDVDNNTRRNAIKETMQQWVNWEQEAKKLWENSYIELSKLNEIYAAQIVQQFLKDTAEELIVAQTKQICLESSGYDMPFILDEQALIYEQYNNKMRCLFDD